MASAGQGEGGGPRVFDPNDPGIKQDVLRLIAQYLEEAGFTASMMTLRDEANLKLHEEKAKTKHMHALKKAILEGDWSGVESVILKTKIANHRSLQFAVYRHQYLELIDNQEMQRAFTHLNKRLKPLEAVAEEGEMHALAYLLTCRSLHEGRGYAGWEGKAREREKLVERLSDYWNAEEAGEGQVPPRRLTTLLQQAAAFQIEASRYRPKGRPHLKTLLEDYHCHAVPNACRHTLRGHSANTKTVCFVGAHGAAIASGSSDNTVRLWDAETGQSLAVLSGHTSRVWKLSPNRAGTHLASASADASVRVWDVRNSVTDAACVLRDHDRDVYSVCFHPADGHLISGGVDKVVRLTDIAAQKVIKTFPAMHAYAITHVVFNPRGNLVISGSKDRTIRFWDVLSGVCVNTFSGTLGEIASVECSEDGLRLLTSSNDNTNRVWDMRKGKVLLALKSHQNVSRNFIRCQFAMNDTTVIGGSEDGRVFVWDADKGTVVQELAGHHGPVFEAQWNHHHNLIASCSQDGTVRTWWHEPEKDGPLVQNRQWVVGDTAHLATHPQPPQQAQQQPQAQQPEGQGRPNVLAEARGARRSVVGAESM